MSDLEASAAMYKLGLGLQELGRFDDHDGFDGRMLGTPGAGFHFEFTSRRVRPVRPAPTPEDLLVFYVPNAGAWTDRCAAMLAAGFKAVPSFNPYWERSGRTFEDRDGYRVVIERDDWGS